MKNGPHASNMESPSCQQTTILIQSHSNRLPKITVRVTATLNAVTEGEVHMQNVVGYVRVSTQGQAKDGYSLSYQVDEIQHICQENNLNLIRIYEDRGISGAKVDARVELPDGR